MDKVLQSTGRGRSVTVTNDGATILKSLHIDNPAAKVMHCFRKPRTINKIQVLFSSKF
ncbi:T-complex protein 1 subunit beta [Iris pallida]|uniref:T-complex protein 1 subunit beta n=1 Tax=Iris pallida TaxID=29817 RepID=A0AAX6H0S1_IRIPA|nr:T-complex protein 1 subunit beta [Iris pallida]